MSSELIKEENGIVFIQKDNVFTNSKIIADELGVKHHAIQQITDKYKSDFEEFGILNFSHLKCENSKRGRPNKIYLYNEQQATLLLTRVRSTKKVREFTKELVRQFFAMREELRKRQVARPIYLEARRTLTDSIKSLPESENKKWKYKQYTDLIYKLVIGKTATQKRKELGLGKNQKITSFLNSEQLNEMAKLEQQATMLIEMGFEYEQIKNGLTNLYEKIKSFKPQIEQYKMIGV